MADDTAQRSSAAQLSNPGETSNAEQQTGKPDTTGRTIEWTTHLLARNPVKGLIPMAVTVFFCIMVWLAFEIWLYVVLSGVVLFLSMARFYLPVRYRLDGEGVRIRFFGREKFRPWSDFKNVYVHRDGIFLAPFEEPSRLDAFRGVGLNYNENKDEVVSFVKTRLRLV
jgi:hypothetical protein